MPHPPILIGHSFGGLIVQLLADRGLGAAAVAIDPTPPFGVPAHPLAVWTSLGVFTAFNGWNRVLRMSRRGFSTGFAQTLPEVEKHDAYERYVVSTPGRIFFQAVLGIGAGKVGQSGSASAPAHRRREGSDRAVAHGTQQLSQASSLTRPDGVPRILWPLALAVQRRGLAGHRRPCALLGTAAAALRYSAIDRAPTAHVSDLFAPSLLVVGAIAFGDCLTAEAARAAFHHCARSGAATTRSNCHRNEMNERPLPGTD
jgi:pimeloyl-ACP methyl ester carboxylesterase